MRPQTTKEESPSSMPSSILLTRITAPHVNACDFESYHISVDNVIDAVMCLKGGKSPDDDEISAEQFLNAPYGVFIRLQLIFNAMLVHSFVPRQFANGSILPLVKDAHGNRSDINNRLQSLRAFSEVDATSVS